MNLARFAAASLTALALLQAACGGPSTTPAAAKAPKPSAAKTDGATTDRAQGDDVKPDAKAPDAARRAEARAARNAAARREHYRNAYETAGWTAAPPEARAIADTFGAATSSTEDAKSGPTAFLDEGLSRVAAKLAADPERPLHVDTHLLQLAQEAGTPFRPVGVQRIAANQATLEWARKVATSIGGRGPLILGVGVDPGKPDDRVIVLTRKGFDLIGKAARRETKQVRLVLHPTVRAATTRLLMITPAGVEHLDGTRYGDAWTFERPTFEGTIAAVVTYDSNTHSSGNPFKASRWQLGLMQFAHPPALPGDGAASLVDSVAALRRAWKRAPLRVDDGYVVPCGEKVQQIAGTRVTTTQACLSWSSSGSDAERWNAMRLSPFVFEMLDDPSWQLIQIRRDAESTTIRLGRAFEDVPVQQVRDRLHGQMKRLFPGVKHDVRADAAATALAQRWAATQKAGLVVNDFKDQALADSTKWANDRFLNYWLASDDEVDALLHGIDPRGIPAGYALGVARGTGPTGEPRYYLAIFLAKAGKP